MSWTEYSHVYLKCPKCTFVFAMRWGIFTHAWCPVCDHEFHVSENYCPTELLTPESMLLLRSSAALRLIHEYKQAQQKLIDEGKKQMTFLESKESEIMEVFE